jgi:shikimate dehydrogenase
MTLKKVAVIGYPVKHSLSPKLHGYWINQYKEELKAKGIEAEYGMLEVAPEDLEKTLLGLKDNGYVGCNLTVPHKEAALKIVKNISSQAKIVGAINTIHIEESGSLFGNNTDVGGFLDNIIDSISNNYRFDFSLGKVVVIGAGGASRAVIAGLATVIKAREIVIINRTKERAEKIKSDLENITIDGLSYKSSITIANWEDRNNILEDANLLVNTTSLGMIGKPELDINLDKLPTSALVTDIVYKPLETTLLKNARNRGNKVVDGLGMLLYQAQGGFELWFGIKPEVTEDLRKFILS